MSTLLFNQDTMKDVAEQVGERPFAIRMFGSYWTKKGLSPNINDARRMTRNFFTSQLATEMAEDGVELVLLK